MPRLTLRDKKGAPARQPAFIRDLKKALARRNTPLHCMLSMDLGRRERLARWDQRWKERMTALELPTDPTILINYLHANENRSSNAVRAIPAKVHPVEADEKRIEKGKPSYRERRFLTRVTHLRDHRFLTLEIDLAAAPIGDLLDQIHQAIITFRPKHFQKLRERKHHKSTAYLDPWKVYDEWKAGKKRDAIAQEAYRKRTGTVADFDSSTPEYKAVNRALKAAQGMMRRHLYPPR